MKRWCMSRQYHTDDFGGSYTHAMIDRYSLQEFTRYGLKTDPETGIPTEKGILVLVEAPDFTALNADADIVVMPDVGLSTAVSAMDTVEKLNAKTKLVTFGFTEQEVGGFWDKGSYGEVLDALGQLNLDTFSVLNFDL